MPKPFIEQCGFGDTVEMRVEHDRLIMSAEVTTEAGLERCFAVPARRETTNFSWIDPEPTLLIAPNGICNHAQVGMEFWDSLLPLRGECQRQQRFLLHFVRFGRACRRACAC